MAVQAKHRKEVNTLSTLVRGWDRRLRIKQLMTWLPRSIAPGLLIGVILAIASRLTPLLTNDQILMIGVVGVGVGLATLLGVIFLWKRTIIDSARRFDVSFDLKETISTAMELNEGRINADDMFQDHQMRDALSRAKKVNIKRDMPIELNWREWLGVLLLALVFVGSVLIPNIQAEALVDNTEDNAIVEQAEDEISDLIEDIATNPDIDEETREELLETLQVNLDTLQDEDVTAEEALATLNDVQSMLEEQAESLQQQQEEQEAALDAALETFQEELNLETEGSEGDESSAGEELTEALQEMFEGLENQAIDPAQASQALQEMSEQLQESAPETAEQLQEMAEQLQEGDQEGAQDGMEELAQQMESELGGQTGQVLSQSATDISDRLEEMTESQNSQQQPSGESQPQDGGSSGDQEQQGEQEGGSEAGEGEGQSQEGDEQSGQGGEGESGSEGQESDGAGESDQIQEGSGGSDAGNNDSDTSGQDGQTDGTGTDTSDGGEEQFEQIFDPRRTGEDIGDTEIILQPDEGDTPLQEGEFSPNQIGDVTVPYNEVFSDYSNAANEALTRGYVPLGMRDIVRDYFTSLSPDAGNDGD